MAESDTPPPPAVAPSTTELLAAGRRLRVDAWTAKVVSALHQAGVRPILLKGPAVARWLYGDDLLARTYGDIDLLVAPDQRPLTHQVLADLGFTPRTEILDWEPVHAQVWAVPDNRAVVDLHHVLHGMEHLPDQRVWDVVAAATHTCVVRGVTVEVPGPPVRTLHLALHLHVRDAPGSQAWRDLERGVERVDPEEWAAAADLARTLGVDADMGVRLRAFPAGAALADRLDLPRRGPDHFYAHQAVVQGRAAGGVQAVARLQGLSGWRARARYVRRKVAPPPGFVRRRYPIARRGRAGLVVAYGWRVVSLAVGLPRVIVQWRRLHRP